jgi:hypothetical protein
MREIVKDRSTLVGDKIFEDVTTAVTPAARSLITPASADRRPAR